LHVNSALKSIADLKKKCVAVLVSPTINERSHMSSWTQLHIVDVFIKENCLKRVKGIIKSCKNIRNEELKYFLSNIFLCDDRYLSFKASIEGENPYEPDELGTIPAMDAKWAGSEAIAKWLKKYCKGGGSIVEHSLEGDGAAWGWEFDGKGKMRYLALKPAEKWK